MGRASERAKHSEDVLHVVGGWEIRARGDRRKWLQSRRERWQGVIPG